jgi:hypothetical protein
MHGPHSACARAMHRPRLACVSPVNWTSQPFGSRILQAHVNTEDRGRKEALGSVVFLPQSRSNRQRLGESGKKMRGRSFAALLVLCTFACGHAAGLPYATVDGKCIDETTLENAINAGPLPADAKTKAVDGCKRACDR